MFSKSIQHTWNMYNGLHYGNSCFYITTKCQICGFNWLNSHHMSIYKQGYLSERGIIYVMLVSFQTIEGGHGGAVVTHSPPTSEIQVLITT